MKIAADKDSLFTLLTWHGKQSPSGLVHISVAENGAPVVIESTSADNGWQSSTLEVTDSAAGQAMFSITRVMAQKHLGKRTTEMTLEAEGNIMTSRVGRSKASCPIVRDAPAFWRPETTPEESLNVIAEVEASALAWLLRTGESMRSTDPTLPTHATRLKVEEGAVKLHSTDGYKMGFGEIDSLTSDGRVEHFISPSALAAPLSIMNTVETIEIIEANSHLGLRGAGSVTLRPSFAAGPPPMHELLKEAHKTLTSSDSLVISVSDLTDALSGVGLGKNGSTQIEVQEDRIVVSSASPESGTEGSTQVEVEAEVPEGSSGSAFKFNAANAISVLKQFRTATVSLSRNQRMIVLSEPEGATPFIANISIVK